MIATGHGRMVSVNGGIYLIYHQFAADNDDYRADSGGTPYFQTHPH